VIVADLQKLLANLGEILSDSGAKTVAGDLSSLATGLAPFREMKIKDFTGLLAWAEQVRREGLPSSKIGEQRTTRGGREPQFTVQQAAELFKGLYDRALQPDVTAELVEGEAKKLEDLTKSELDEVARGVGLHRKFKTKVEIIGTLRKRILERKGMDERARL
jgi:hypothetical protein